MFHNAGTSLQKILFLFFLTGREVLPKKSRKSTMARCHWVQQGSMKRGSSWRVAKGEPSPILIRRLVLAMFSAVILFLISDGPSRAGHPPVRDVNGAQLKAEARYYVMPVQRDRLRGFFSGSRNGTWCPMHVKQAPTAFGDGILVTFAPVDGSKTVRLSTDLNIEFYESNPCPEKPVWTLAPTDNVTGRRFVRLGGVVGSPGLATMNNWFRIEKDGDHYKLVFCPSVCETCKQQDVVCGDLGVYRDVYDRWLVLGGRPLTVKFKRYRR